MGTAVLVIFGVICAGLIAEVGVRVANRFFPYFYCYDAALGWGLRPNTAGYYRREGAAYVEINNGGFRGPEVAKSKPPGTIRIAVLGDSYTEAIQVPYEDTFASVAARKLAQCPLLKGRRVEALNFGVDGYGTTQELMTLREKVWAYQPDFVVLAIFLGNDVRNNSVSLEGNLCRPFYVERNGKLAPAGPFESSTSFRLWCMTRFDYRKAGASGSHSGGRDLHPRVLLADRLGSRERLTGVLDLLFGQTRLQRQRHRDHEQPHRLDRGRVDRRLVGGLA